MKRLLILLGVVAVMTLGSSSIASGAPAASVAVCHWDNINQVEDQQYLSQKGADSHLANHVGLANHNYDDYAGQCYGRNHVP